jgi:hypothetical protein
MVLLSPSAVQAQEATASEAREANSNEQQVFDLRAQAAAREFTIAGQEVVSEGSPTDRASAGFTKPTLQFTSEEGETGVSLAFSLDLDDYQPIQTARPNFYRVSRTQLSLVASAPIAESEAVSRLFAGDSLVTGTKVKFSLSRLTATLGNGAGGAGWRNEAYLACISANSATWLEQQRGSGATAGEHVALLRQEIQEEKERGSPNYRARLNTLKATNNAAAAIYDACVPSDRPGTLQDTAQLVNTYTDKGKAFADLFYDKSSYLTFYGLDASVGRDDYEYLDRTAFQLANIDRTNWEVGAYAGVINSDLTFSARARVVYGRHFESAEDGKACHTFTDTLEEQCLTGPDGLPIGKKEGLISIETRHLFALDKTNRIALAPQFTYRFEDDSIGVEVPVYLAPGEGGKLTGGLKFAYNSGTEDEFGIGVFVGIPFSIFFR